MADKPEVGFQFGVEGDAALLSTIQALRNELKQLKTQQDETSSSAETLSRAWSGLIQVAAALKIAEFAKDVFDTAVNLGKLSQITGVSTETLSVYYKAATDVGVAHEAVDKSVVKLARSFVQLQQGNKAAAAGFGLLHLSAKDFVGLNADEKLRKVTDAFAGIKDGGEKAAAAQALFSKGGAALIPVLDQLGKEQFKEVADQAERLGLIFTHEMAEGALRAKASLEELKGVAEGATAQLETGLLPAVADAADALGRSVSAGGVNGFKTLGEYAGTTIKFIVNLLNSLGVDLGAIAATIVEWVSYEFDSLKQKGENTFIALKQLAKGDFSGANETIKQGARDAERAQQDASDRISAVWKNAAQKQKEFYDQLWNGAGRKPLKPPPTGAPGDTTGAQLEKGLDRTEASGLKQQAQDELTLFRDLSRQKLEEDKRDYDQGIISLEEYFNRRRAAIQKEFTEELKARGAEKIGLQDLLTQTQARPTTTPQQDLAKQREVLQLKQQIAHIDAENADDLVKRDIDIEKNENDRANAKQSHLLKELEAQKKLADLEGSRSKSAQLAIQIEDLQLRKELEQLGKTKIEIDAFVAQYGAARNIKNTAAEAEQGFEGGTAQLSESKAALQEKVADNQLLPYQAERQLRAEYEKEIPILQAKIELLRQQAAAAQAAAEQRGEKGPNAEAVDLTKEADKDETALLKLQTEMVKMDTTWMSWKTEALQSIHEVSAQLTTGFNGWIQGQERFGQAARKMWNGLVMTGINGLEKLAASFIEHHLRMLVVKQTTNQLQVASDASAAAQKNAIETATAQKSIIKSAKSAAAKAFNALAGIPIIGPILGAIAAAATFVAVMAFASFAKGGYVGAGSSSAPRTVAFATGGQMAASSMLGGGYLRGPGSTTSDSIPAMLSDKEYVVSAKGVQHVGVDTLNAINNGALKGAFLPPIRQPAPYSSYGFSHYASGGVVKTLSSPGGRGSNSPTIHQHIATHSSTIDSKDFRDHVDEHMDYIADSLKLRMRNMRWP